MALRSDERVFGRSFRGTTVRNDRAETDGFVGRSGDKKKDLRREEGPYVPSLCMMGNSS